MEHVNTNKIKGIIIHLNILISSYEVYETHTDAHDQKEAM